MTAADEVLGASRATRVRRRILALSVALYMITYVDRVVMSAAAPSMQKEFGLSLVAIGWIFAAFQVSYALFQIPVGWLGDRFGARRALSAVVLWWSVFTAGTAVMGSVTALFVCRVLFGIGEAGAYPIGTRALLHWTLPTERGWALGLTHAGARLGGAITPVLVVFLIARLGWRAPFFLFALVGLAWTLLWYGYYRDSPLEHRGVNAAERRLLSAALAGSTPGQRVAWGRLLRHPQVVLLSAMYFCYSYGIGIFLTWFPKYLSDARHFDLSAMGLFASVPLMVGVVGDVLGGWNSDLWLRRTANVKVARRGIAVCGFLTAGLMIPLAALADSAAVGMVCFCVAVFGLEMTVGVSWAVTLDIGGEHAGSVSAIMNTLGNFGTAVAAVLTGYVVARCGWTAALWIPAGLSLLAAILYLRIDASRRLG